MNKYSIFLIILIIIIICIFFSYNYFKRTEHYSLDCTGIQCPTEIPHNEDTDYSLYDGKFKYNMFVPYCNLTKQFDTAILIPFLQSIPDYLKNILVTVLPLTVFTQEKIKFNIGIKQKLDIQISETDLDLQNICFSGFYFDKETENVKCFHLNLVTRIDIKNISLFTQYIYEDNIIDYSHGTSIPHETVIDNNFCSNFGFIFFKLKIQIGIIFKCENNKIISCYLQFIKIIKPELNTISIYGGDNKNVIGVLTGALLYTDGLLEFILNTIEKEIYRDTKDFPVDCSFLLPFLIPFNNLVCSSTSDSSYLKNTRISTLPKNNKTSLLNLTSPLSPSNITFIDFIQDFFTVLFSQVFQFLNSSKKSNAIFLQTAYDISNCSILTNSCKIPFFQVDCCEGSTFTNIDFTCSKYNKNHYIKIPELNIILSYFCKNFFSFFWCLLQQLFSLTKKENRKKEKMDQLINKLLHCVSKYNSFGHYYQEPPDSSTNQQSYFDYTYEFVDDKQENKFSVNLISFLFDFNLCGIEIDFDFNLDIKAFSINKDDSSYFDILFSTDEKAVIKIYMYGKGYLIDKYLGNEHDQSPLDYQSLDLEISIPIIQFLIKKIRIKDNGEINDDFEVTTFYDISTFDYTLSDNLDKLINGYIDDCINSLTNFIVELSFLVNVILIPIIEILAATLLLFFPPVSLFLQCLVIIILTLEAAFIIDPKDIILLILSFFSIKIEKILNDFINKNITNQLKKILTKFQFPFTIPEIKVIENTYNCSCRNICARNWEHVLSDTKWKDSQCVAQENNICSDPSKDISSCTTFINKYSNCSNIPPSSNQKTFCYCMDDSKNGGVFASNAVSNCNSPLYIYNIENTNRTSCDFFCQEQFNANSENYSITSDSSSTMVASGYCLNSRSKSDPSKIYPCSDVVDEDVECLCVKDKQLYIPYADSNFNIYGNNLRLPVGNELIGMYIINQINNKFLVNFEDQSGQNIVDGLPIKTSNGRLPLKVNIYGERSIWFFEKIKDARFPNIIRIKNKFDNNYLYDPNEPIPFKILETSYEDLDKIITFEKLRVVPYSEIDDRFKWKLITRSNLLSIVNVYSNRCVIGIEPQELKKQLFSSLSSTTTNKNKRIQNFESPGLSSFPGSYNMYYSINEWTVKLAQVIPSSTILFQSLNKIEVVVNITNVGYQDCLTLFKELQNVPSPIIIENNKFFIPTDVLLISLPYPPLQNITWNQWYLQKLPITKKDITSYFTIRSLMDETPYYLIETPDNKIEYQIISNDTFPDNAQWIFKNVVVGVLLYTTIQNKSTKRYLKHGDLVFTDPSAYIENLLNKIWNYTTVASFNKNDHSCLWSINDTTPMINPINFYRNNPYCPFPNENKSDTSFFSFCDENFTGDCHNLQEIPISQVGVNLLNNPSPVEGSHPNCIVNVPSILSSVTFGTTEDQQNFQTKVDSALSNNEIPYYTMATSPCFLYGQPSVFNLKTLPSTNKLRIELNTDTTKCLNIQIKNGIEYLTIGECLDDGSNFNLIPISSSSSNSPFSYNTDFLISQNTYYLVSCSNPYPIFFCNNGNFQCTIQNITTQPTFWDSNGLSSQLLYETDGSHNFLSFPSISSEQKYIGIDISKIDVSKLDISQQINLPIQLLDKSNIMSISLEFILCKFDAFSDYNVYGYLVRSINYITINDIDYIFYLINIPSFFYTDAFECSFLLFPIERDKYNYVFQISKDLQDLFSLYGTTVLWSFNDTTTVSRCSLGNPSREFQLQTNSGSCLSVVRPSSEQQQGIYPSTNISYIGTDTCNSEKYEQKFFIQQSNYQPQDYPYISGPQF